jgi:hypothetical protein
MRQRFASVLFAESIVSGSLPDLGPATPNAVPPFKAAVLSTVRAFCQPAWATNVLPAHNSTPEARGGFVWKHRGCFVS